ncbi:MAG: hypothetical protein JO264_12265 [Acidisphaera sp.]|nr:hypothetical protein [Acidisphaera sp.]
MSRKLLPCLLSLMLAGCAYETPLPSTSQLPPMSMGSNGDQDIAALNLSSWAFASPSRTANDPVNAARAAAAVDYLAGELQRSPRWDGMSVMTKMQMVRARDEVRRTLGVAANAPSQAVVNGLVGAANALSLHDTGAAEQALSSPAFSRPAPQTLAVLNHLPYLQMANVATQHAAAQAYPEDGGCPMC